MSERGGLLRNRWIRSDGNKAEENLEQIILGKRLEQYPPSFQEPHDIMATVFYIASNKNSPYKDAESLWQLCWEEFIAVLDWCQMRDAGEYAANPQTRDKVL